MSQHLSPPRLRHATQRTQGRTNVLTFRAPLGGWWPALALHDHVDEREMGDRLTARRAGEARTPAAS